MIDDEIQLWVHFSHLKLWIFHYSLWHV